MTTQKIVLTINVEVPEVPEVSPVSSHPVYTGYHFYRFSESKNKAIPIREMHPCHILNAVIKDMENMSMDEIMHSPVIKEMLHRVADAIVPVI